MSSIETISVSSFMTRDVKTEEEDQNVLAACRIMHENNIGSVIIVKKDDNNNIKPAGIITDKDIFRTIMNNQELMPNLLGDKLLIEPKTLHDRFGQYWFSDILRKP